MKKLYLLDAFALIFRAYYALIRNPRITSTGRNTNAQFGFTNTLLELINKEKPSHIAVCFDTAAPTERHTDFTDYKANRQEAPEDLLAAVPDIKRIIQGFNIPVVEVDGYEADDVVGTIAWQAADLGYEVYMVTPDKDYGQLLTKEGVYIYKPAAFGNGPEILKAEDICQKWDIDNVAQVIDMLGMMGDAVDNIPGIPGVGEKTAAKLLKQYGNMEAVLADADNIKGALGEKIRNGKELAVMSKKLATIITNVPVQFHEEDYKLGEWNKEALKEVFTELEFKTLGRRILGTDFDAAAGAAPQGVQQDLFGNAVATPAAKSDSLQEKDEPVQMEVDKNINNTPHTYHLLDNAKAIDAFVQAALQQSEICFDTETTNIDANLAELVGMSFAFTPHEAYYVPCPADRAATLELLQHFKPLFDKPDITWIGQNIKYDLLLLKWYQTELAGPVYDTMLAHYVAEPEGRRSMDLLAAQYLGYQPVSITELIGKKGKDQGNMRDVEMEKIKDYAAEDADITLQLKQQLAPLVLDRKVDRVLNEAENPLVKVLTAMEFEGVRVDETFLNDYSKLLEQDASAAEKRVYENAGVKFNLASPSNWAKCYSTN